MFNRQTREKKPSSKLNNEIFDMTFRTNLPTRYSTRGIDMTRFVSKRDENDYAQQDSDSSDDDFQFKVLPESITRYSKMEYQENFDPNQLIDDIGDLFSSNRNKNTKQTQQNEEDSDEELFDVWKQGTQAKSNKTNKSNKLIKTKPTPKSNKTTNSIKSKSIK